MMRKLALLLGFLFLFLSCRKTESYIYNRDITFSIVDNYLQGYFIYSIAFDSKGNAWVGTFDKGLIKFDGRTSTVYDSSNSILTKSAINSIAVDSKDNVWIGADGLIRYDGKVFTRFDNTNSIIPTNYVTKIAIDNSDNLWFSASRFKIGGLMKYNGKDFFFYSPANSGLPYELIHGIAIGENNSVWISVANTVKNTAITNFDGTVWNVTPFDYYYWGDLAAGKNNHLAASIDYGFSSLAYPPGPRIILFDGTSWKENDPLQIINTRYEVRSLVFDQDNLLWASLRLDDFKLAAFNGSKWFISDDYFKISSPIFTMAVDKTNQLWLGTGDGIYIVKKAYLRD